MSGKVVYHGGKRLLGRPFEFGPKRLRETLSLSTTVLTFAKSSPTKSVDVGLNWSVPIRITTKRRTFEEVLFVSQIWVNGDAADSLTSVRYYDETAVLPPISGGWWSPAS